MIPFLYKEMEMASLLNLSWISWSINFVSTFDIVVNLGVFD